MMESAKFDRVEVVEITERDLICELAGRRFAVPRLLIDPRSRLRAAGDRGKLVIPRWLAIGLGLIWPFSSADRYRAVRVRRPPGRAA